MSRLGDKSDAIAAARAKMTPETAAKQAAANARAEQRVQVNFLVDQSLRIKLKIIADRTGVPMRDLIESFVIDGVNEALTELEKKDTQRNG